MNEALYVCSSSQNNLLEKDVCVKKHLYKHFYLSLKK